MQRLALLLTGLLISSSVPAAELIIDLKTDYATTEFRFVRVELLDRDDERVSWTTLYSVSAPGPYLTGVRIAELDNVDTGHNYHLVVQLLDGLMRPVNGRVFDQTTTNASIQGQIILVARP